jgi:hypothetical protein
MIPMRAGALSPLFMAVSAAFAPLPCQVPTTVDRIPIYPSATRSAERGRELSGGTESGLRVYRVKAAPEDVVKFYQQRLAAREIRTEAERDRARDAYERLAAGQVSAAVFLPEFVNLTAHFAAVAEAGEDPARTAAAYRAAYTAKRAPFRPDTWVKSAIFEWGASSAAGRRLEFYLGLEDVGEWQIREPAYFNETEISINVTAVGAQPEAEEREAREERPPAAPMAAPAESDLGVPLYPGAQFDGRMSAAMSGMGDNANYYVYTTADAVGPVTAFYQLRTGKQGLTNEGGTLIAVRGEGLFPDLGVAVQPNVGTYPPAVKTMITIRKKK